MFDAQFKVHCCCCCCCCCCRRWFLALPFLLPVAVAARCGVSGCHTTGSSHFQSTRKPKQASTLAVSLNSFGSHHYGPNLNSCSPPATSVLFCQLKNSSAAVGAESTDTLGNKLSMTFAIDNSDAADGSRCSAPPFRSRAPKSIISGPNMTRRRHHRRRRRHDEGENAPIKLRHLVRQCSFRVKHW